MATNKIQLDQETVREVRQAFTDLLFAYEQLMPGLVHIAVKDYANINEAPLRARKAMESLNRAETTSL